jgi:hypothetical protein
MSGKVEEILINKQYTKYVMSEYSGNSFEKTEPTIIKASINTDLFMKKFMKKFDRQSDLLPHNCRFFKEFPTGYKLYVIEEEPKIRTISFNDDVLSIIERHKQNGKYEEYNLDKIHITKPHRFTLSFPYVIYLIYLSNRNEPIGTFVYFRLHPLTNLNNYLLKPCLSNIGDDYHVCLGFSGKYIDKNSSSTVIRQVIDEFWFNSFNYDYDNHLHKYQNSVPELSDFFTWQYHTQQDPLFIYSTNWIPVTKNDNINGYVSLADIIQDESGYQNSSSNTSTFSSLLTEITRDEKSDQIAEIRSLEVDNVILDNKSIVSVGDEIILDKKKYYVTSFMIDSYGKPTQVNLEDENRKILQVDLKKGDDAKRIFSALKENEIKQIKINKDTTVSVGEFVVINSNSDIRVVEKIVKARDGILQMKIGRDFYLPSSFVSKNISKLDLKEFTFHGATLEPKKIYYFINETYSDSVFRTYEEVEFIKPLPKEGKLHFQFKRKDNTILEIFHHDTSGYKFINPSEVTTPLIYRIHDELFLNEPDNKLPVSILRKRGLGITGLHDRGFGISERKKICNYNSAIVKKYFTDFCNEKKNVIKIESFDHDVYYGISDEVIQIDWTNPSEMFVIKTIVGFHSDDNGFYLVLSTDEGQTIQLFPLIVYPTGKINCGSIRRVIRQIDDYEVGMKIKAAKTGIPDFPVKDCNVISAFVVDYLDEDEPLVLFSNYRTIWYSSLTSRNFKVIDSKSKVGSKMKVSPPNPKIKIQDGDIFISGGNAKLCSVYSNYYHRSYLYNLSLSSNDGFRARAMMNSKFENSQRYGLLYPRTTEDELNNHDNNTGISTSTYCTGIPSIYGDITPSVNMRIGLRRLKHGEQE